MKKIVSGLMLALLATGVLSAVLDLQLMNVNANSEENAWPMFHCNPQHTACSPYLGPQANDLLWKLALGGVNSFFTSPAISADGTIYAAADSFHGKLFAIDRNGTVKWIYSMTDGEGIDGSSPAIGLNGTIFVGARNGKLYAINPDGTLNWAYSIGSMIVSSPTVGSDGAVYVGSTSGLYALDPNGTLKWKCPLEIGGSSPAIGSDGVVYVGSRDGKLYAVSPDGTVVWAYSTESYYVNSSPAIDSNGTIYIGEEYGRFLAINPNGTLRWNYSTTNADFDSSPSIDTDGTVFVGGGSSLYSFYPNGTLRWAFPTGGVVGSVAIGSDGTSYFGSGDYRVYAVNPDGTLRWTYLTSYHVWGLPAIGSDGTLYIGDWNCILYAIVGPPSTVPTCSLAIIQAPYGSTDPTPGTHNYAVNSTVQATATPNMDFILDHWELDGFNAGSTNPYWVPMDSNHTLKAVFVYSPAAPGIEAFRDEDVSIPLVLHDWGGVANVNYSECYIFIQNKGFNGTNITYSQDSLTFFDQKANFTISAEVIRFGLPGSTIEIEPVQLHEKDVEAPNQGYFLQPTKVILLRVGLYVESLASEGVYDWDLEINGYANATGTWTNCIVKMHAVNDLPKTLNVLANGNFETETLDGWDVEGACALSNTTVHSGLYSACISNATTDNSKISQVLYPNTSLALDSNLYLEGWINPSKTGIECGDHASILLEFCDESTMEPVSSLAYTWSGSSHTLIELESIFVPFYASMWNHLSRNVTADMRSAFPDADFSHLLLYRMQVIYWYSEESDVFYADDLSLCIGPPAREVAVTNVAVPKNWVHQGRVVGVNATVANLGDVAETFDVTAYANATIIGSENVTLPAGNSTTITFTWNYWFCLW